jgi:hypothetical protein
MCDVLTERIEELTSAFDRAIIVDTLPWHRRAGHYHSASLAFEKLERARDEETQSVQMQHSQVYESCLQIYHEAFVHRVNIMAAERYFGARTAGTADKESTKPFELVCEGSCISRGKS